jgi:hypothetical protein
MRKWLAAIVALIPFQRMRKMLIPLFREELFSRVWWLYFYDEDRRALAWFCQEHETRAWKQDCPHDFWLIWISALYESGDKVGAARLIKRYTERYGTSDIFRYVLAAKCAIENGISDPHIEKSAVIADFFINDAKNKELEKLISGKRIAVVGSSPNIMTKEQGSEIDNHNIVIRFNNFQTNGYERYCGRKTDVWMRNSGSPSVRDRENIQAFKAIIWENDVTRNKICIDDHLRILHRDIGTSEECLICFISHDCLNDCRLKANFTNRENPSMGLLILHFLTHYANPATIDCYGFSFLDDGNSIACHYFEDTRENLKRDSIVHNIRKENEYLQNIFKERNNK